MALTTGISAAAHARLEKAPTLETRGRPTLLRLSIFPTYASAERFTAAREGRIPAMSNFGMIWEVPKKPSIDDALAEVRLQARADGILIPEDAEPIITEHLPSDRNPNGSLDVIFEWGGRSASDPESEEESRGDAKTRGDGRPSRSRTPYGNSTPKTRSSP
jgi:hypothetical protein